MKFILAALIVLPTTNAERLFACKKPSGWEYEISKKDCLKARGRWLPPDSR